MSGRKAAIAFAIPGDIDLPTGGYGYDRRLLAEWQRMGVAARHLALPGSFPSPTQADLAETRRQLLSCRDDETLLIDGLAYGAFPESLAAGLTGRVVALDCKFVLDDAAAYRQEDIVKFAASAPATPLEQGGAEHGLKFIQLDGNVGVLANGAGLTMTTMDVIRHFGGRPANFLEIGGEAYTRSAAALDLVLSNPGVKSLVINFCGAFARTDVMAEGVVKAWQQLKPKVPVFFSIHGTGEEQAVALVRAQLGIEPYDLMEDAVQAAVRAAQ